MIASSHDIHWLELAKASGYLCMMSSPLCSVQENSLEELEKLEKLIEETQGELDDILPRFQAQKEEEEGLNSR